MRIARAVLPIAAGLISPESGGAHVKQLPELDQPDHLPFAKVDAGAKATKWLRQIYVI